MKGRGLDLCVAGVICEYNPFHLGHEWMLQQLRAQGAEAIVCVMSGNFVQRGDLAIADKLSRAEMAVRCGADVVLELPTPWAAATAEHFATGGVTALACTGVVTDLAFGSECGDAALLQRVAAVLDSDAYHVQLRELLRGGESFAVCRQKAVAALLGEDDARVLDQPNNNLGVEYCRALSKLGAPLGVMTVLRRGADHDGAPADAIASASHIRRLLLSGRTEEAMTYLPRPAADVLRRELAEGRAPVSMAQVERSVLARLRSLDEDALAAYDGGGEGLYHRFYQAIRGAGTIDELLELGKTKRYTHARLRRMVLAAWLDLPVRPPQTLPCLRLLGCSEAGRSPLRQMRDGGAPILTRAADAHQLGAAAQQMMQDEAARTDLYTLAFPDLRQSVCGRDWRTTPFLMRGERA